MFSTYKRSTLLVLIIALLAACATKPPQQGKTHELAVRHLLLVMNQRLAVAPLVAKSKWNSGAPVDDPAREQQILDDIGSRAKQAGLDARLAKDFFQSQFDAGKIIQLQLHAKWRQQHLPHFDNAPDLGRDVRPVLDKLTPELIAALNELQTHLCDADIQRLLIQQSMQVFSAEWDQPTRERALAPLLCAKNA